jgi:hypothetical protein
LLIFAIKQENTFSIDFFHGKFGIYFKIFINFQSCFKSFFLIFLFL